jgi:hypothetical protein
MSRASRAEWAKRVERWKDSGLSAKEFAAETGVKSLALSTGSGSSTQLPAAQGRRGHRRFEATSNPYAARTCISAMSDQASAAASVSGAAFTEPCCRPPRGEQRADEFLLTSLVGSPLLTARFAGQVLRDVLSATAPRTGRPWSALAEKAVQR